MARNELGAIISGIFALIIFLIVGGAIIDSLSQIGNTSFDGLISFIFLFSTITIFIALIGALWKTILKVLGN